MARISRRNFVAGAAAIPFAVWFEKYAWAQTTFVRYDARSANGQAMLKTYANAVRIMRDPAQYAEGNPRGWTFQWYTHFVKGSTSKAAEIARIYPAASTWKNLANEMWNTCQAHSGQPENYFLPWHRMFVFFFEQIVRQVTKTPSFALPYWNYSVSGTNHGVLPAEFRMPNDPTFKYLYVSKRNANANNGTAIDAGQPDAPLSLVSLNQCTYGPSGAQPGFCQALDFGLHGNVHVLTGNGQNMGSVPWAAYDPIFWMHHSNIDRLWASWNAAGRKNPNDSTFLNKTFVFVDGNGTRVVAKISDFLSIAQLNYRYDRLEPVTNVCPANVSAAAAAPRQLLRLSAPLQLSAAPVRTRLAAAPSPQATVPLGQRIQNLGANRRLFLVLRDLRTNLQPEVLYHLYLELPATAKSGAMEFYVGNINFFDTEHRHHEAGASQDKFYSFDITDLAKRLRASGHLAESAELTIAPAGKPAATAQPVIGEVTLVEQ
ncbi:MAG: tyrosinase family protein [Acidobacteriota bacterium]|nr:tyrosinase family protein [Acidobacteriota bacterium]